MENVRIQFETTSQRLAQIERLMSECGIETKKEFFNNAITLLNWAVTQVKSGKIVASVDETTERYRELQMPIFSNLSDSSEH